MKQNRVGLWWTNQALRSKGLIVIIAIPCVVLLAVIVAVYAVDVAESRANAVVTHRQQALEQMLTSLRSTGVPATGLELHIARDLAAAMGGRLAAESQPGRGSVLTLELSVASRPNTAGLIERAS